jgi:hypothetical protein
MRIGACIALALAGVGAGAAASEGEGYFRVHGDVASATFFAATGWSGEADGLDAAEEATRGMLLKFADAGVEPVAVVFLERTGNVSAEEGALVGERIRELAAAPVFGHGGAVGTYGLTFGALEAGTPGLMVLGLGGRGLQVSGYAVGGAIEHSYERDPDGAAARRAIRRAAEAKGEALGRAIPKLAKPGFVLTLAALHNDWHVPFYNGLHKGLGGDVPIVGGVGKFGDYVYANGRDLTDADGEETPVGQLALVVQGDLRVGTAASVASNAADGEAVLGESREAAREAYAQVGRAPPGLILAFSCVTRLATPGFGGPGLERAVLREAVGSEVPVFGCYSGGEVGFDAEGRLSVGGDRYVVGVVAGVEPSARR